MKDFLINYKETQNISQSADCERAARILRENGATCVFVKGKNAILSRARGITPLLALIESGKEYGGYSAADTVVGRAAAMLYLHIGIAALHARVISASALELLIGKGIAVVCDTQVERIINRRGDGICPMDAAIEGITDLDGAYAALSQAARHLPKAHWQEVQTVKA